MILPKQIFLLYSQHYSYGHIGKDVVEGARSAPSTTSMSWRCAGEQQRPNQCGDRYKFKKSAQSFLLDSCGVPHEPGNSQSSIGGN